MALNFEGDIVHIKQEQRQILLSQDRDNLRKQLQHGLRERTATQVTFVVAKYERILLLSGNGKIESYANQFELYTLTGERLFSATDKQVYVGADRIAVAGKSLFANHINKPLNVTVNGSFSFHALII